MKRIRRILYCTTQNPSQSTVYSDTAWNHFSFHIFLFPTFFLPVIFVVNSHSFLSSEKQLYTLGALLGIQISDTIIDAAVWWGLWGGWTETLVSGDLEVSVCFLPSGTVCVPKICSYVLCFGFNQPPSPPRFVHVCVCVFVCCPFLRLEPIVMFLFTWFVFLGIVKSPLGMSPDFYS
jgi:hypothetical protein